MYIAKRCLDESTRSGIRGLQSRLLPMSLRNLFDRLTSGRSDKSSGSWAAPYLLDAGPVGRPKLAVDGHGNLLAAWHHRGEGRESVFICRYRPESGWDLVPRRLDTAMTAAQSPEVVVNGRGEMAVLWQEHEGPDARVCARNLVAAEETWVPHPVKLMEAPGEINGLQACMDKEGSILAVWCHGTGGRYRIYASTFNPHGGWDRHATPLGPVATRPLFPQLAISRSGQGLVAWDQDEEGESKLLASHYTPDMRCWSDHPIEVALGRAAHLRMDMDWRGNAIVLWVEDTPAGQRLNVNHLDSSSLDWTVHEPLALGANIQWPQIGMDDRGNAIAVWRQSGQNAAQTMKLMARRCVAGRWEGRVEPLVADLGQSRFHTLAVGWEGEAIVIWAQWQNQQSAVYVRRFGPEGWSPRPVLLGSPGEHRDIQDPQVFLAGKGKVAAIWRQGDPQRGAILSAVGKA